MPATTTNAPIFANFSFMSSSRSATRDKMTMVLVEMKDARRCAVRHVVASVIVRESLPDRLHAIFLELVIRCHNRQIVLQCRRDNETIRRIVMDVR